MGHLKLVLEILQTNKLFAKLSKCRFGMREVDYLWHIISAQGVKADLAKIRSMIDWPMPKNSKALRGFLGLTGYYQIFIKNYGLHAAPLTNLLRKNAFKWSVEVDQAFKILKKAVTKPRVIRLLDFTRSFVIECDASGAGMRVVLM